MKKICSQCKIEKELNEFNPNKDRKSGYRSECKECRRAYVREYKRRNRESVNERQRDYKKKVKNNGGPLNNKRQPLTESEKKSRRSLYSTKYNINRKSNDPLYKLITNLRSRIGTSIKQVGFSKKSKTQDILGISFIDFKVYIEKLFQEGMNWDNYGDWHLDHIVPISLAKSEKEVYELNHYTNFQPLWEFDNLSKGNRYK